MTTEYNAVLVSCILKAKPSIGSFFAISRNKFVALITLYAQYLRRSARKRERTFHSTTRTNMQGETTTTAMRGRKRLRRLSQFRLVDAICRCFSAPLSYFSLSPAPYEWEPGFASLTIIRSVIHRSFRKLLLD